MESSAAEWFSDMGGKEPSFIDEWELSSLDLESTTQNICEGIQQTLSSESYTFCPSFHLPMSIASIMESSHTTGCGGRLEKIPMNSSCTTPHVLSFGDPVSLSGHLQFYKNSDGAVKPKEEMRNKPMVGEGPKRVKVVEYRPLSHNQEHAIAEKARREKITQRLVALSTIIPGVKKMDKASVLMDAITYMKQLQEKVKALEDQAMKGIVESAVLITQSPISAAYDEKIEVHASGETLPIIEANISEKTVIVKIQCENRKGILVKALSDIENLHLTVINSNVIPFAGSSLDITVVAQIEEGFSMTVKDIARKLTSGLRKFK